jgi:phosphoserine phosphatase
VDIEQVVVRGRLTLAVLVTSGTDDGAVVAAAHRVGAELGMTVSCVAGHGDNAPRPAGRLHVTLLGAPLLPAAVAAIAERLAERGANIDRIRRLARTPVTAVEFDVSGDDVAQCAGCWPSRRACTAWTLRSPPRAWPGAGGGWW